MTGRAYFSFPLIFFVILVVLTVWLDRITQPTQSASDAHFYHHPDYIVEDLSGIRMDYERGVHREFFAKKLTHYVDEKTSQMENIYFVNTEPDDPLIRLQSDRAEVHGNGDNIYLTENVAISRGMDDEKGKITLVTDFLHILPKESIVKTDQPVKITRMNTTIHAVGLELNNHTGMIQLLSQVRAVDN
ncbi:MAG: LPS export ABC transporter periplasmic protein LptC [Pseudomonadota bacterium]